MKHRLLRATTDDRLIRATHWAVFSLGALALAFSIVAATLPHLV
ncbi:hypothetical protein [Phaeovulum veldkampii]|nr:hypothetical protein [Phaeovulum veldkampii]TDQ55986.1 hypothetical protein EV658_12512 [Phaeovulum veldkampii DSM 11550]